MSVTVRKIGKKNEYTETFRCSCGHDQDVVTLGYKMTRRQLKMKKQLPCFRCQMKALLSHDGKECLGPGCIYCDEEEAALAKAGGE